MIRRSISVLIIEDNINDFEFIRRELYLNQTYQFDFAATQQTTLQGGLDALVRGNFDAVILDLNLPDSTGTDSLKKIKAITCDVPVIILTATEDEVAALKTIEAGAQDYLVKGKYPGLLSKTIAHSIIRNDVIRKLEKSERTTRSNSQNRAAFFDNMSHEIRTPLTSVIGFSEALLRAALNPGETKKALQSIYSNGRHLLQVINDILDLSKIEAGEMKIDKDTDKLQPLLCDLLRTFSQRAKDKNIVFSIEFEPPTPLELDTDFFRLKQILLNLIGNAVKFTSEGFVKLTLRGDQLAGTLTFEIKDSGPGIPDDAKNQLFKNFSQGRSNVAKNFGGSGLGLVICDQLAQRLGGKVEFYSRVGIGSVFSLIIPLEDVGMKSLSDDVPNLEELVDTARAAGAVSQLKGHALIVDDFEDNRDLLSLLLRGAGMTVDTAEDGQVALAKVAEHNFDIILLDMQMPRMGGREVAKTLRAEGKTLPIVAVTASVLEESMNECLRAGCDACLRKPFRHEELLECVAQFLSQGAIPQDKKSVEPSVRDDELGLVRNNFKKKLPRLLGEIEGAYDVKDLAKLKSEAHRMVGAGLFGFSELSHLGGVLETLIMQEQTGGLGLIEALVKRIKNEVSKIALQNKGTAEAHEADEATASQAAIMVIDDDEVNLKVVCRNLSTKGFMVAPARTSDDALALCDEGTFALLVISLDMGSKDGAELLEKLRGKLQAQLPVIFMTSRSFNEVKDSLTSAKIENVLTKPIQRDALFEAIDSLVIASLSS